MSTNTRTLAFATAIAIALLCAPLSASAYPIGGLVISEILFAPSGGDNGREWVEIYNRSDTDIQLSDYSLGWGRDAYDDGTHVFASFLLGAGDTFVIGGSTSEASNGNPSYGEVYNFSPNLRNGTHNSEAAAMALFFGDIGSNPSLTPRHAVIYGESTTSTSLLNEQGAAASVLFETDGFSEGTSIEWLGSENWQASASLNPNVAPTPEPGTAVLLGLGLTLLAAKRRNARR